MRFFRRFVVVGLVVTASDLVGTVALVRATNLAPIVCTAIGVVIASLLSFALHRAISYPAEPARRWYSSPREYVVAATAALCVDATLFGLLVPSGEHGLARIIGGKLVAVVGAFCLRLWFYRTVMFRTIRGDQAAPAKRVPPVGEIRLSVVIPAFHEQDSVAHTIRRVREELASIGENGGLEIVIVDDGSHDLTAQAARDGGADTVIQFEHNRGKGAAVRAGMLAAQGRTVAFTDVDLAYSPLQIIGLCEEIEAGWDVVVGSRKHTGTSTLVAARRIREIGGRVINAFTSAVLLGQYRDTQCGLKAFRNDVAKLIFSASVIDGFAFDVEVFHLVERYRLTLLEVPVSVENSTRSTVHIARDASRLVRDLFRIRRRAHSGGYEADVTVRLPPPQLG